VTEPQKPFKLKGYKCHHALPHHVVQSKLNASICVMEACTSTLRRQEVNYLSVICDSQPFRHPTLLACLYLNPNAEYSSLNAVTLSIAADDITDWLDSRANSEKHYVLTGDFNATH
jgi:exonuclease III